jgi:bifunctional DNase/RNase
MTPSRPLTHDLFKSFAVSFGIEVQEVIIYNLVEGIFFAKLICVNGEKVLEIDARTSDAIAISVRFNCPIYTYEFILSTAGIILEEGASLTEGSQSEIMEEKKKGLKDNELTQKNVEDLNQLLQSAIEEEDYEKASKIRDEIKKRKQS